MMRQRTVIGDQRSERALSFRGRFVPAESDSFPVTPQEQMARRARDGKFRSLRAGARNVLLAAMAAALCLIAPAAARADYVVLRNGSRLNVSGYEIVGDKFRLHLQGGFADVPVDDIVTIEPEEIFQPSLEPLSDKTPFQRLILAAAARHHLDPDLIHSVIAIESNFNPKVVSPKNARGLMQLMPRTAELMGVADSFDPEQNIEGGTRYLSGLLKKYKNNLTLALAAYNAGPDTVDKYGHSIPPYLETMKYVQRIAKTYAKLKADASGPASAQPSPNAGF